MNANHINELAKITLLGTKPFPEIISSLIAENVEYYHVDYMRLMFTFYGTHGGVVVAPLIIENLSSISHEFNAIDLRAAILDSQQNGQKFVRFCERAVEAGVVGYYAFLRGKRVTYFGRTGENHVEWFPGFQPKSA